MANLNKVFLVGRLTRNIELKYTPSGKAVVSATLAINRQWKQGDEVKKEVTFVPVVLWERTAEIVNQYCGKGSQLMVEGRIQIKPWEKDGMKQWKTEIVAENVQLIGGAKKDPGPDVAKDDSPVAIDEVPSDSWLAEEVPGDGLGAND